LPEPGVLPWEVCGGLVSKTPRGFCLFYRPQTGCSYPAPMQLPVVIRDDDTVFSPSDVPVPALQVILDLFHPYHPLWFSLIVHFVFVFFWVGTNIVSAIRFRQKRPASARPPSFPCSAHPIEPLRQSFSPPRFLGVPVS